MVRYAIALEYARAGAEHRLPASPAPVANLPCSATVFLREEHGYVEVFARSIRRGRATQRSLACPGIGGCLPRGPDRPHGRRRRRQSPEHDRRPRSDLDRARPVLPGPALPGDRQRHRLPGQQRPGPLAFPGSARRHDQVLDPDPGAADQQAALLLQRLLRHPAAGAAVDPAPHPRHQPAPLQPAQPGLGQGAHALPGADGQIRLLAEGRKGRHRRPHRSHLGPRLRPGPAGEQRLARQPRTRHSAPTQPTIRQGEPLEKLNRRATFGCKYSTARLLYTATLVEG